MKNSIDDKHLQTTNDEIFTVEQAREFLNIGRTTLHLWKKEGILKYYRLGRGRGRVYFKKSDLIEALENNTGVQYEANR